MKNYIFGTGSFAILFLNYLETNIVEHCNLNYRGCAHFSNISDNNFVNLDHYEKDIKLLSQKFNV